MTSEVFLDLLRIGLSNGMIVALIALGYTMVYGIIELINFAHGDLLTLGCFAALSCIAFSGSLPVSGSGQAWILVGAMLVLVPAFGAGLNWCVDRLVYRPIRRGPKLSALVSAIGVSFIFVNLALFWGGIHFQNLGGLDVMGRSAASSKNFPILISGTAQEALVFSVTLGLLGLLVWLIRGTRMGRAMRATAQDPTAARLMGVDVDRVIGHTFLLGGALAGVDSVLYCLRGDAIHFQFTGFRAGMDAFTAAVLGGIGNLQGAVLGALIIGLVRSFSDTWAGTEWTNTVVFAILVLLLVFKPSGLLGTPVREKV